VPIHYNKPPYLAFFLDGTSRSRPQFFFVRWMSIPGYKQGWHTDFGRASSIPGKKIRLVVDRQARHLVMPW
jgi:hypothetical protein